MVGLFFGHLPGLAAALCAGTFRLPLPGMAIAAIAASAGLVVGAACGIFTRIDRRGLLVHADRLLESRELSSTALELSANDARGIFAAAVIEDAASLLRRTTPRRFLGRLRLPFAPFLPLVAALTIAAFLFPFDFRLLFAWQSERELVDIGNDLRKQGQSLQDAARAQNLGRSLALSQELARLGKELADHQLTLDEALERMSDLESRLTQEYQLALKQAGSTLSSPGARDSTGHAGDSQESLDSGGSAQDSQDAQDDSAGSNDPNLKSLGDALNRLRADKRRLSSPQKQGTNQPESTAQAPQDTSKPRNKAGSPKGGGGSQAQSPETGNGSSGEGNPGGPPGGQEQPGGGAGSQAGTTPAPSKTGNPTTITQGSGGPSLKADGSTGEGDMARLLARSLPDMLGSRLPDATVLSQYARQAESALSRDEVPRELREYVKGYFTIIGVSKSGR
jgi:hypothetical protein